MRRSAFTWIELIFVIVILGILAATAIAKLGNMGERAKEVQLQALTGTLNRTSGAGFWFRSINEGRKGSVAYTDYDAIITQYIEVVPGYSGDLKLSNCVNSGDGVFVRYPFASTTYEIHCKDGSSTESPFFRLYNATEGTYLY